MKHIVQSELLSSKVLINYIKDVENFAGDIIYDYFNTVKKMPIKILSLQLDTKLSTENTFSFSIRAFSEKYANDMFWSVNIPTKVFDVHDKHELNVEEVFNEIKTNYLSQFR